MTTIPVSVVVITRNEAVNLPACLASCRDFAQVVVVDSGSMDATRHLARAYGASVVDYRWGGDYPKKKQWCLESLPLDHPWILLLDADERISPPLAAEIAALMRQGPEGPGCNGYFIRGQYCFLGRVLRWGMQNCKLALLHRHRAGFTAFPDQGLFGSGEVEMHYQPWIEAGAVATLRHSLLHDAARPLHKWFARHNAYSDWEAALRVAGLKAARCQDVTAWRRLLKWMIQTLPGQPFLVFFYSYVLKLGFLDGMAGFHFAVARGFYAWQVAVKTADAVRRASSLPSPSSPCAESRFGCKVEDGRNRFADGG